MVLQAPQLAKQELLQAAREAAKRRVVRVSTLTFTYAIKRLLDGPCTVADIEAASGLHRDTAARLLASLCTLSAAHECGRAPDSLGRMSVRLFALGAAPQPQI